MRGLDPRIHLLRKTSVLIKRMDCRVKPGNDELCQRLWGLSGHPRLAARKPDVGARHKPALGLDPRGRGM